MKWYFALYESNASQPGSDSPWTSSHQGGIAVNVWCLTDSSTESALWYGAAIVLVGHTPWLKVKHKTIEDWLAIRGKPARLKRKPGHDT